MTEPNSAGTTTEPMFGPTTARAIATVGMITGLAASGGILALAWQLGRHEDAPVAAVLAFAVAGVGGVLLVCVGVGYLAGEAVITKAVTEATAQQTLAVNAETAVPPESFKYLKEALSGLTAARAAIFAGVFLLAVSTGAAGVAALGGGGTPGSEPTPTPTTTTPAEPPPSPPSGDPATP